MSAPLAFALLLALAAVPLHASTADEPPAAGETTGDEATDAEASEAAASRHSPTATISESVTVTATRNPTPISEVPGQVSVIGAEEIEHRLVADAADLVRYEPGVHLANDPTRLGLSGFNIRGIGGNRVLTRIDGVPTADGFDFERLAIQRYTLDPEVLQRVEIVRSSVSTLYGSDALGGVVSLITKDPGDYLLLGDGRAFLGTKLGWDGRSDETSGSLSLARGGERWGASLWTSYRDGGERDNQGERDSLDGLRTTPNPIDRSSLNLLGKTTWAHSDRSFWKLSGELYDAEAATEALSQRGVEDLGPTFGPGVTYRIDTADFDAEDTQERWRLSLEQTLQTGLVLADRLEWRLYGQADDTGQSTVERRVTTTGGSFFGPLTSREVRRDAVFEFQQDAVGGEVQLEREWEGRRISHHLTWGAAGSRDELDMLRDRTDVDLATGAEVPASTPFPTKYFPASTSTEMGAFVQDEIDLGDRLRLVPGVRYDRFSLDPDTDDEIFLTGNPGTLQPVELTESAVSPRLGAVYRLGRNTTLFAQYAGGFRAPSYSEINNGFSNFTFGYRTLPNPDLEPETSDNRELGVRWASARGSFSLTGYDNRYDDFIETRVAGVDPATGLIEFQPQNVASARIRGVEVGGDWRFGRRWTVRGAYTWIEGEDEADDRPLNSIAPPQLVAGLGYRAASGLWGAELTATMTDAKDASDVDRGDFDQFATPGYEVFDLTAFRELGGGFSVQAGLFNLTDETYYRWPDVAGQVEGSPTLERYSSPGFNAAVAVRYRR